MTIAEIRDKILHDDAFVLSEVKKIQNVYRLKHEIRYAQDRVAGDLTESVAEHTWGMHVISQYFLLLENEEDTWDRRKISTMITWHDLDEIIIGDIVSYKKHTEHTINERTVQQEALKLVPEILGQSLQVIFDEYDKKETREAKFVKAIDKIEGYIQMYQSGFSPILHSFGRSKKHSHVVIGKHVEEFKYIKRFYEVLDAMLESEGYFVAED